MISIIAAISSKNRAMGIKNELLWKLDGDLKRFRAITEHHPVIMGRKTYESIGRPLPNRTNIVITRNPDFKPEGVVTTSSLEEALKIAKEDPTKEGDEIFVIGGGEIYTQALSITDRLYLTLVDDEPFADTFFPPYDMFTKELSREEHLEHTPPFSYVTLER